jgi:hypothetical protein
MASDLKQLCPPCPKFSLKKSNSAGPKGADVKLHLRLYPKLLLAITLLFGLTGHASVAFNKIGVRCATSTRRKRYQFQKTMQLCVNQTHTVSIIPNYFI